MFCTAEDLANESDVEHKFLWPLLTSTIPTGLGYLLVDIKTKPDIRRLRIDKGNAEKLYHPDYVIVIAGIPVFIIEAKHPSQDVREGLREARLYAQELNASFATGINPCLRVLSSNGLLSVSAPVDQDHPDITLRIDECSPASLRFDSFVSQLSRPVAQANADRIRNALTSRPLSRALQLLGGRSARDEDVGYNDFGSQLAIDFRHVFSPESRKERAHIVRNAYVPSNRREHYVDEIDRIIKTAVSAVVPGARLIENTDSPQEILAALRSGRTLENQIMLLIGARGAGKSTFLDYCQEVRLPQDLLKATLWVHLNLNDAPSERTMLERWLLEEVVTSLRRTHPAIDFDIEIQKVFAVEINRLRKGALSILDPDSDAYKVRVADQLVALQTDPLTHAKAMARFLAGERNRLLIVVFDNCDKRERDEQLQAFQAAKWLQQQIRSLVILPLRDVTYEAFKDQPPLDTMIKDLVFQIEPPSFTRILRKRLNIVLDELAARSKAKMLQFTLDNNIPVSYPATELGCYLACIFRSLYEYDRLIRSLIIGLAGRDIRRAMEIFLEFCRSGHIGPAEYLKIKNSQGDYSLSYHVVSRVLLRRNRRFYNGDTSFLKNLFQCDPNDAMPDVFIRADILDWLKAQYRATGPSGVKGFHRCSELIADLMPLGHDAGRIRAEIGYLVTHGCVIAEHQKSVLESDDDLVRIAPSGFVHLSLIGDLSYLAACAEETWVESTTLAQKIADRIARFGPRVHYSPVTVAANAADFVKYLESKAKLGRVPPTLYLQGGFSGVSISTGDIFRRAMQQIETDRKTHGWDDFEDRFIVGMECTGSIEGIKDYGCFVSLDGGPTGLIYYRNLPADRQLSSFNVGERVNVRILSVQIESRKLSLGFVAAI
jgi:Type I restriction enzyme R protein N terminus (HSDR_N)